MTQNSQLHFESVTTALLPALCMLSSNCSEQSRTVRHLADHQHLEAELPHISSDDPFNNIEDLVYTVVDNTLTKPAT